MRTRLFGVYKFSVYRTIATCAILNIPRGGGEIRLEFECRPAHYLFRCVNQ